MPALEDMPTLTELVADLQARAHEYANRIHVAAGMLELDMNEEAQAFLASCAVEHSRVSPVLVEPVGVPALAGLLLAKAETAERAGVALTLHPVTRIESLPMLLSELDAVSVLGNLIDNAIEAVADLPPGRRRVEVGIDEAEERVTFTVEDSGLGLGLPLGEGPFRSGRTSKPDHFGLGLTIVREAVERGGGTLSVEEREEGTRFRAVFPADGSVTGVAKTPLGTRTPAYRENTRPCPVVSG